MKKEMKSRGWQIHDEGGWSQENLGCLNPDARPVRKLLWRRIPAKYPQHMMRPTEW